MEFQDQFEPDYFPPLNGTETPISVLLKAPPPPREDILKEVLTARIVGEVVAVGGTGKGHLNISLGLSLATGKKIGPLIPSKEFKVLYLAGEDGQEEIDRRIIAAVEALWPGGPPPTVDNFMAISVRGKMGPLMKFDQKRNPVNASPYNWLCKTLENLPDIDVLILDPKSKFYGLDENDNSHCAAWINCLESLVARFNITILFSHHESKARTGNMDQASSRGGSALTDGCRWVANIKTMDDATAKTFQIPDPRNFVMLDVSKSNYAPKLPGPIYFRRGVGGALSHVDLSAERVLMLARKLLELLAAKTESFSRNDLIYEKKGKAISDKLKEAVSGFSRAKDINLAVDYAKEARWLSEIHQTGKKGRGKSILQVTEMGRM
jgi:replicative DNA helicase